MRSVLLSLVFFLPLFASAQTTSRRILDAERFHSCALTDSGLRCWEQANVVRHVQKILQGPERAKSIDPSLPSGAVQVPTFDGKIIDWDTSALQGCAIVEKDRARRLQCWPIRNGWGNEIRISREVTGGAQGHEHTEVYYASTPQLLATAPVAVKRPERIKLDDLGGCIEDLELGQVCWTCPGAHNDAFCPVRHRARLYKWPSFALLKDDDRPTKMYNATLRSMYQKHDPEIISSSSDKDHVLNWAPTGAITTRGDVYSCALHLTRLECRANVELEIWHPVGSHGVKVEKLAMSVPSDLTFFHVPEASPLTAVSVRFRGIADGLYAPKARYLIRLADEIEKTSATDQAGLDLRLFAMNVAELFFEFSTSPFVQDEILPEIRRYLTHYNAQAGVKSLRDIRANDSIHWFALVGLSQALVEVKPLVGNAAMKTQIEELVGMLGIALGTRDAAKLRDAISAVKANQKLLDELTTATHSSAFGIVAQTLSVYLGR